MNRLTKAWLALTGRLAQPVQLREVVKEVPVLVEKVVEVERKVETLIYGNASEVTLFKAVDPWADRWSLDARSSYSPPDWHGRLFATCEQAFAECPQASVVTCTYWRIGREYYERPQAVRVKVQPKPKRPKGKVR